MRKRGRLETRRFDAGIGRVTEVCIDLLGSEDCVHMICVLCYFSVHQNKEC